MFQALKLICCTLTFAVLYSKLYSKTETLIYIWMEGINSLALVTVLTSVRIGWPYSDQWKPKKFEFINKMDLSTSQSYSIKSLVSKHNFSDSSPHLFRIFSVLSYSLWFGRWAGCVWGGWWLKGRGLVNVWWLGGGGCRERERGSIYITSSLISCHQFLSSEEPDTNN